jgi:anti-sigma factor RsiW
MSCSVVDLKGYFLGEIDRREAASIETHLGACTGCREELDRLRLTQTALLSIGEEEVPRRIAFVSDGVFEPRWWQTIWRSGPAMGFASAMLIAASILVHAYTRPVPAPAAATVDTARLEQRIGQEVDRRVQAAVTKAVSEMETRDAEKTTKLLDAAEKRFEFQRQADLATAQQVLRVYQQQIGRMTEVANAGWTTPVERSPQ